MFGSKAEFAKCVSWLVVTCLLSASCATTHVAERRPHPATFDPGLKKSDIGSRIVAHLVDGAKEPGTLLAFTDQHIVIRSNAGNPSLRIAFDRIRSLGVERE
ncbi:MAG: hypothetical protein ABIH26_02635 [Candidatus Eisenbacteria bacterium]